MGKLSARNPIPLRSHDGAILGDHRDAELPSGDSGLGDWSGRNPDSYTGRPRRSTTSKPSPHDAKATDEAGAEAHDGTTSRART